MPPPPIPSPPTIPRKRPRIDDIDLDLLMLEASPPSQRMQLHNGQKPKGLVLELKEPTILDYNNLEIINYKYEFYYAFYFIFKL